MKETNANTLYGYALSEMRSTGENTTHKAARIIHSFIHPFRFNLVRFFCFFPFLNTFSRNNSSGKLAYLFIPVLCLMNPVEPMAML